MWKKIPKVIVCALLLIAIFVSTINGAKADGMILPTRTDPGEIMSFPEIKYHIVNVTIDDRYAMTHVDQEFHNPKNTTLIGTYLFPVPEGAVLSKFTVNIDGNERTSTVMAANEAQELFQQAVMENEDASLLQYLDNSIFSCEVSIPPMSSIRMTLQYEEILTMNGGMYRYAYTLSTEQYSSSDIDDVSINLLIGSENNIDTVYSPTHTITTERVDSNQVLANYHVENARPDTDFELYYALTDKEFGASLLTYDDEKEGFFMMFFNSNGDPSEDYVPKDIVFVIDQSGSMSGDKIIQAKDALAYILEKLGKDDRFNIINFNSNVEMFSTTLEGVNPNTIEDALTYVENIDASGSTNINDALLESISLLDEGEESDSTRTVFFLTDGLPTSGVENEEAISENVRQANIVDEVDASIFVFGVGYDVNTHLLDRISNENHGGRAYVDPDESIEDALIELYAKIQNPLLTDISIEFQGMTIIETFPGEIPNLYEGSEIVLVGRYVERILDDDEVSVHITGSKGSEELELIYDLSVKSNSRNSFIPRIWATRRIGVLMDEIKQEGETEALKEEIMGLGLGYGIVTPYTSLLIEEQKDGITAGMGANQDDSDGDGMADAWGKSGNHSNQQSEMNFAYRESHDVHSTSGANILSHGNRIFAKIDPSLIELALLADTEKIELGNGTISDWIPLNLNITVFVTFGSQEYFALLENEEMIEILAAGTEIVFSYGNDIYYVSPGKIDLAITNLEKGTFNNTATMVWYTNRPATGSVHYRQAGEINWQIESDNTLTTRHIFSLDLPDGEYEFYISSEDGNGNNAIENARGKYHKLIVPADHIIFSTKNISIEVIGTTAVITWDTDHLSKGKISFRTKGGSGSWRLGEEGVLTKQHSIELTSLSYGEFEYYLSSVDENGNTHIDDTIRWFEIISPDGDGDGLPDNWEKKYGLDPADPSDVHLDPDGDGYTNLEEYYLDSNPNEPDGPVTLSGTAASGEKGVWDGLVWMIIIGGSIIIAVLLSLIYKKRKKSR